MFRHFLIVFSCTIAMVISQPMCTVSLSDYIGSICSSSGNYTFPYCNCLTDIGSVDCSGQYRKVVPSFIPKETKTIILKNNDIAVVKSDDFHHLEMVVTLDLTYNYIRTIENGAFDRLYRLVNLFLSSNRLQAIASYFFLNLASLEVIKLDNNQIVSVKGDAFITLPSIEGIDMTNNTLQCGCETRILKKWIVKKRVTSFNGTCVNVGAGKNLMKVNHNYMFNCAEKTSVLSRHICRQCSESSSSKDCEKDGGEIKCLEGACYSQILYGKKGLTIWKGCSGYKRCLNDSQPNEQCYNSDVKMFCHFCCVGNLCNDGDIGNRFQIINFNVTVAFYYQVENIREGLVRGLIEKELKMKDKGGIYNVHSMAVTPRKIRFFIKYTTPTLIKKETVYDYLYDSVESITRRYEKVIESFEVTNKDTCLSQTVSSNGENYHWSTTGIGNIAYAPCPVPFIQKCAKRYCQSNNGIAKWGNVDYDECHNTTNKADYNDITMALLNLESRTLTNANAENISTELNILSENSSLFSPLDLRLTVSKLDELVKFKSNISQPVRDANIASIISNVLETSTNTLSESQQQSNVTSRFIGIIQEFVEEVNLEDGAFSKVNPNCALFAFNTSMKHYAGLTLYTNVHPGQKLDASRVHVVEDVINSNLLDDTSTIIIPSMLAEELNYTSLSRITLTAFRSGNIFSAISDKSSSNDKLGKHYLTAPNSVVLSASIPNMEVNNLKNPIFLRFIHKEKVSDKHAYTPQCSFWDVDNTWSTKGCYVSRHLAGRYTECTCNHLTNFALIMDIYGGNDTKSGIHKKVLSIISYSGCSISLFTLLVTLVCYLITRKLRSTNPGKLLINLSIALVATNIIFIVGQQSYAFENYVGCMIVGILMHYFLLSALTWMSIEAFFMYLAFVKIFNIHVKRFLLKSCLLGWGVPLVIVGVTVGVSGIENYGLQAGDICWLTTHAFYRAFLGPVLLILMWNVISFVLVTRKICESPNLKKSVHSDTPSKLRRAVSVVVLFGLTWIFAFFAIDNGGIVFQYLFSIFNSLQGFFIFVLYCLLNKEMKTTWERILPCSVFADDKALSQSSKGTDLAKHSD